MISPPVSRAPLMDECVGGSDDLVGLPPRAEVLTRREREVLELVTQGYANRQIAARLSLSTDSINTSVRLVYRKIGVSTRAEAIRWGMHHGAGC